MKQNSEAMPNQASAERKARIFVIAVSIAIPLAVAVLYFIPKIETEGSFRSFLNMLPLFNAVVNGSTAIILVLALLAIKKKNVALHRLLMTLAMVLSIFFLLSYVLFHSTTDSTPFPKDAPYRSLYLIVLLTHILISAIIIPLVLISYTRALAQLS